jgi:hypothetical protein
MNIRLKSYLSRLGSQLSLFTPRTNQHIVDKSRCLPLKADMLRVSSTHLLHVRVCSIGEQLSCDAKSLLVCQTYVLCLTCLSRGNRDGQDRIGRGTELGSLEIKGSLAETESIFRSPKASTLGTLLSVGRSDDLVSPTEH